MALWRCIIIYKSPYIGVHLVTLSRPTGIALSNPMDSTPNIVKRLPVQEVAVLHDTIFDNTGTIDLVKCSVDRFGTSSAGSA